MTFEFTCLLRAAADSKTLETRLDGIMDELCRLGVVDPWIGATLSIGEVEIGLEVEASSFEEAASKALATIRAAIHAAGSGTPDWPAVERIAVEKPSVPAPA